MRAILLAAGFGSRLRPLTDCVPKCLVDIHGKPLLQYWLEMLNEGGVQNILINTHYLPDKVNGFIENSIYKGKVKLVFEEYLLGTGGTLLANRDFFGDEPVMLIHADNLSKFDLTAFINAHYNRPVHAAITMMTFETDSPTTSGILELDGSDIVKAFHEKVENPPGNLANGAVYIIEPGVVDYLAQKGKKEIDFSNEVIPAYIGRIYTFHNNTYHRDIGNMESYKKALNEYHW